MSMKQYVIGILRDIKLSKHDTIKNAVDKIKHGAIRDVQSQYAAKKNHLWDVTVREAVFGYNNMEVLVENELAYGDDY